VNGSTWFTNSNPLVLTHSNGTIALTTISVRLNASTTGTYTGQLQHTSSVGGYVQIALNGTTSGVTAVGQVALQKQFSVTPNPVHSSLVINHPKSKDLRFTIYQAGGEKLIEAKATNNTSSTTLSVDRLTAGNYFVECQNKDQRVVLNFIKIH
jgi:hypothetical protein